MKPYDFKEMSTFKIARCSNFEWKPEDQLSALQVWKSSWSSQSSEPAAENFNQAPIPKGSEMSKS